jgi:hypothetical protein
MKPWILIAAWITLTCFADAPFQAQGGHDVSVKPEILSLVDPAREHNNTGLVTPLSNL